MNGSEDATSIDISHLVLPHLDRHLALPVLNYLEENAVHDKQELLQAKYELLRPTNMVHYVEAIRKELGQGLSLSQSQDADVQKREDELVRKRDELREKADKVIEIISNPDVATSLGQDKERNLATLKEKYGLDVAQINDLYQYGQFAYSLGDYAAASDYLNSFRILSVDPQLTLSAFWGKLVSNILEEPLEGEEKTFDAAMEELKLLKDDIEANRHSRAPAVQLQQRAAWLHWSLFVYFRHPKGMQALVEAWTESTLEAGEKRRSYYLDTIQSSCPWLLRYLVAAVVVSHTGPLKISVYTPNNPSANAQGKKSILATKIFQVLRVVEQEKYQYSDAVTEFFRLLVGSVDFEGATTYLKQANDEVLKKDYWLNEVSEAFTDRARHFMSEVYCRIHHKIDIADLSSRLGLSAEEGERWIVELVRDARLDAKVDLQKNIVTMNKPAVSVHQTISDRAKQLLDRAQYVLPAPAHPSGEEGHSHGQQRGGDRKRGGGGPKQGHHRDGHSGAGGVGQGQTPKPVEVK